jgi:hypothetical protein
MAVISLPNCSACPAPEECAAAFSLRVLARKLVLNPARFRAITRAFIVFVASTTVAGLLLPCARAHKDDVMFQAFYGLEELVDVSLVNFPGLESLVESNQCLLTGNALHPECDELAN